MDQTNTHNTQDIIILYCSSGRHAVQGKYGLYVYSKLLLTPVFIVHRYLLHVPKYPRVMKQCSRTGNPILN